MRNIAPNLLCPNCIRGILFHDLGLQLLSLMVNTMVLKRGLVKLVLHLDNYVGRKQGPLNIRNLSSRAQSGMI